MRDVSSHDQASVNPVVENWINRNCVFPVDRLVAEQRMPLSDFGTIAKMSTDLIYDFGSLRVIIAEREDEVEAFSLSEVRDPARSAWELLESSAETAAQELEFLKDDLADVYSSVDELLGSLEESLRDFSTMVREAAQAGNRSALANLSSHDLAGAIRSGLAKVVEEKQKGLELLMADAEGTHLGLGSLNDHLENFNKLVEGSDLFIHAEPPSTRAIAETVAEELKTEDDPPAEAFDAILERLSAELHDMPNPRRDS